VDREAELARGREQVAEAVTGAGEAERGVVAEAVEAGGAGFADARLALGGGARRAAHAEAAAGILAGLPGGAARRVEQVAGAGRRRAADADAAASAEPAAVAAEGRRERVAERGADAGVGGGGVEAQALGSEDA